MNRRGRHSRTKNNPAPDGAAPNREDLISSLLLPEERGVRALHQAPQHLNSPPER